MPQNLLLFQTLGMARDKKRGRRPIYFKEWRKHAGLTQEAAAERAQLSQGTIARLESRKIEYTESSLEALAHAYGCDNTGDLFRPPVSPKNDLADYVTKMDEKKRNRALKVLQAMEVEDEVETKTG
jgi:transcriptional regulator with XRE-family HTH domain